MTLTQTAHLCLSTAHDLLSRADQFPPGEPSRAVARRQAEEWTRRASDYLSLAHTNDPSGSSCAAHATTAVEPGWPAHASEATDVPTFDAALCAAHAPTIVIEPKTKCTAHATPDAMLAAETLCAAHATQDAQRTPTDAPDYLAKFKEPDPNPFASPALQANLDRLIAACREDKSGKTYETVKREMDAATQSLRQFAGFFAG
jgi:hypothetical protein